MRWDKALAIYRKEIRELLRDKKTIFLMIALPLLIYPLLIMGISSVMLMVDSSYESSEYRVRLDESVTDQELIKAIVTAPEDSEVIFTIVDEESSEQYSDQLTAGSLEVYLSFDKETETYNIIFNSSDMDSDHAADYLNDRLKAYQSELSIKKFEDAGLDSKSFLEPIVIKFEDLASNEQSMGQILGMIVPLLLIMGVFLGTMTPAVDVTAGEKERGTQETLMSFPISGHELICGKYLAVATAGVFSAFLYLLSVGILAAYMMVLMGGDSKIQLDVAAFVPALLVVVISTMAFSLFLGAAIMCICSFAKSSKEASSYVSPIMIVIMLIAYMGYLDVHLTTQLSIIPVLNIVLLIKSVLAFEYNALAIIIVLVSNIAYAAIAISLLGKLYTSERILFGEKEGSLFERRSKREAFAVPAVGDSVLVLAVTAVLYLYIGSLLQVKLLILGVGLTQLIILFVPVFFAWFGRVDYKETFSIKKINIKQLLFVIPLALGGFIVCNMACQPLAGFAPDSAEEFSNTFQLLLTEQSPWLTWLIVGIAPAICEEALFRGYFYGALKNKVKPWLLLVITALVFGIYHLNLYQGTYAFLLGLVLAFAVYKTGSIFSSMLIHFICNSIAVMLSVFPDQVGKLLPFLVEESVSTPTIIILLLVGLFFMGIGIFGISKSKN